jgi:hypothetical protein
VARTSVLLVALIACERSSESPQPRPVEPVIVTVPSDSAPEPEREPPPPPPPPTPRGPPRAIARLARPGTTVSVVHLYAQPPAGKKLVPYMEWHIRAEDTLEPADAKHLLELLAGTNYTDGANGCVGFPVGIRLRRGTDELAFAVDCGNVFLPDDRPISAVVTGELSQLVGRYSAGVL